MSAAYAQAGDYCDALPERECPRYILVSDFWAFHFYDLDERDTVAMTWNGSWCALCSAPSLTTPVLSSRGTVSRSAF